MDQPTDQPDPPGWTSFARLAVGALAAAGLAVFLFYEGPADRSNAPVVVAASPVAR